MREHFARQIVEPVDFVGALEALRRTCDVIVEVGPGNALSNLIAKPGGAAAMVALPVERSPEAFGDLNWVLASAHTSGVTLRWDEIYSEAHSPAVHSCEEPVLPRQPLRADARRG